MLKMTLYLGGTRSGKSLRAEKDALRAKGRVLYVATAESRPEDTDMQERIRRHRERRLESWTTLECPRHLAEHIARALSSPDFAAHPEKDGALVMVDCVTMWIANIFFSLPASEDGAAAERAVKEEVLALLEVMERFPCEWVLVSGETGLGGIHADVLSRRFCDLLGTANQLLASRARDVYLVVAGRVLRLED